MTDPGGASLASGVIQSGLLNPHLLARVRHTNTLVIADSMFPHWPGLVEVDLSLIYGVPTVPQDVAAVLANWKCGPVWMAAEFQAHNSVPIQSVEMPRSLSPNAVAS